MGGTLILDENKRKFAVIYTSPTAYRGGALFGLAEFVRPEGEGHVYLRLFDENPVIWENLNPHATAVDGEGFSRELAISGGWYDKIGNLYEYYQNRNLATDVDAGAAIPELTVGENRYESVCWDSSGLGLTPSLNKLGVMTGLSAPKANLPVRVNEEWDYSAENTVSLTIGLARATGIFKGSFKAWFDYNKTHTSKSIPYEGVLTPEREDKEDGVEGRGFFLWSDPSPGYPFKWSYDFLILGNQ
jgi:hypothetical protein